MVPLRDRYFASPGTLPTAGRHTYVSKSKSSIPKIYALFNEFNSTNNFRQSSTFVSSSASNTLPFPAPPGCSTLGSTVHSLIVSTERPASMSALPKASSAISMPSQLFFSARPSNGDADACTPLSPLLGTDLSPSSV